jgi:pimeloyl-ACP methyl ester carboxylesterase
VVRYVVKGEGLPVTLLVHGIAGSRDDSLSLANALTGTRVLVSLPGHDDAEDLPPGGWDWELFADELRQAVVETGATGAIGVSAGAGALLHLVEREPALLQRLVVALPAVVDTPRGDQATERLAAWGPLIASADVAALTARLLADLPPVVAEHRAAGIWALRRARLLCSRAPAYPALGVGAPVKDLAGLQVQLLVIAQEDDELHPLPVALALAGAVQGAQLAVLPPAGMFWTARERVGALLADFFALCPVTA